MKILFIEYPTCSTCRNAKKYLKMHHFDLLERNIVEDTPTKEELARWWNMSGLPLKKFFNTSGNLYKELRLKDKILTMSEDEQLTLLSMNGMLIKRPLLIQGKNVLIGFKEDNYKKLCSEC